jgi:hypothetical protein
VASCELLHRDGRLARELYELYPPRDMVIPAGQIINWDIVHIDDRVDPTTALSLVEKPPLASFRLGKAWCTVKCKFVRFATNCIFGPEQYFVDNMVVTVQGTDVGDFLDLRDRILDIIHGDTGWGEQNDLNIPPPMPGFFARMKLKAGLSAH